MSVPSRPPGAEPEPKKKETVGVATMLEDGTLRLMMNIGSTLLTYPPSHPRYADTLKHIDASMKPGDSRPVPAWD